MKTEEERNKKFDKVVSIFGWAFWIFVLVILFNVASYLYNNKTADIYTLYRDGMLDKSIRIHWATFDNESESEKQGFNKKNCENISDYYNNQNLAVRFWCEKGKFKE